MLGMSDRLAFGVEPSNRRYRLRLARYQGLAEAIAELARSWPSGAPRMRLLDVGSGNGRTLRYLEAEGVTDLIDFYGLEYSERRIAGMYGRERWRIVRADAQYEGGFPFADAVFDCVICEQVLEHLHFPQRAIGEMGRVLRPDGILIAGVPTFPPGLAAFRKYVIPAVDRLVGCEGDHVQAFSLGSFARVVRDAGAFDIIETRGFRGISGGPLAPLENYRWFWRLNRAYGRALPWFCAEVQVIAAKRSRRSADATTAPTLVHAPELWWSRWAKATSALGWVAALVTAGAVVWRVVDPPAPTADGEAGWVEPMAILSLILAAIVSFGIARRPVVAGEQVGGRKFWSLFGCALLLAVVDDVFALHEFASDTLMRAATAITGDDVRVGDDTILALYLVPIVLALFWRFRGELRRYGSTCVMFAMASGFFLMMLACDAMGVSAWHEEAYQAASAAFVLTGTCLATRPPRRNLCWRIATRTGQTSRAADAAV
jgi:SAM-dependent methyltransferase